MLLVFFVKLNFIVLMLRFFFLLSQFLVVKEYGLSKSTIHLLSVQLTLEYVRILSWSIPLFFFLNCLYNVLCNITIWADDTNLNSSFSQQFKTLSCNLILQHMIVGKYFYFSSAMFWFWKVKNWYLKLLIQVQTLEAVI